MAGEQTAKVYEALTAYAISRAKIGTHFESMLLFREVELPGISIRSDVILGYERQQPEFVFLVTHSNRETDWEKKFKRDASEVIELVNIFPTIKGIFLVLFDSRILPGLQKIAEIYLTDSISVTQIDSAGIIESYGHNTRICQRFSDLDNPTQLDSEIQSIVLQDPNFSGVINIFINRLRTALTQTETTNITAQGYIPLVSQLIRDRSLNDLDFSIRNTRFNRAISKLAMFSNSELENIAQNSLLVGSFNWAAHDIFWPNSSKTKAPMMRPEGRASYRCIDPEIIGGRVGSRRGPDITSIFHYLGVSEIQEIIERGRQPLLDTYLARIQSADVVEATVRYIARHYQQFTDGDFVAELLQRVFDDPQSTFLELCQASPSKPINWHWLYAGLVALFKAASGKKQGYGYSKIARRMTTPSYKSQVEHSILQHLDYRLKSLKPELIQEVAHSLAEHLSDSQLGSSGVSRLVQETPRFLVWSEVEDKFLPNAVDVLPAMIQLAAERSGLSLQPTYVVSCLAEATEAGGTAGRTNVFQAENTIIWYKAAHLSHTSDKRKELQSTVASWRQQWNPAIQEFQPNDDIKRTVLIIDGDWSLEELQLLYNFGWDYFLYPDELDRLPDLII